MTHEQLTEARMSEALRLYALDSSSIKARLLTIYQSLIDTGWTPKPKVLADVLAARNVVKAMVKVKVEDPTHYSICVREIDSGSWDDSTRVQSALAGIAHERAKQSATIKELAGLVRRVLNHSTRTAITAALAEIGEVVK